LPNNFVNIITDYPIPIFRTIAYKASMKAPINKREIMSGCKKLSSAGTAIAPMRRGIFPMFILGDWVFPC
jgi:hypothetical protein